MNLKPQFRMLLFMPYIQDRKSSFLYFFGLDLPGLTAIIDIDEDTEILFGDDVSTVASVWLGAKPSIGDLGKNVGIETTRSKSDIKIKKSSQFGLKSLRLGKKLEEGHVLTIEPGIYIIPQLIDQWTSKARQM